MLDVNTIQIVPKAPSAGYVESSINEPGITQGQGKGTGDIIVEIIDHTAVEEDNEYNLFFNENGDDLEYSLLDLKELSDTISVRLGQYSKLSQKNADSTVFSLASLDGNDYIIGVDYDLFNCLLYTSDAADE